MRDELAIWIVASAAAISTIASSALDLLLAFQIGDDQQFAPLRSLLFAAFSLQLVASGCLAYFGFVFTRKRKTLIYRLAWIEPSTGAGFNATVLAATGVALVWLTIRQDDLPQRSHGVWAAGLVVWAVMVTLHVTFFMLLAIHVRRMLERTMPKAKSTNFGITLPPVQELAVGTRPSFCSRGTTLASRPQTPTSTKAQSLPSSATKVASSFRTKFARNSARSSFDVPSFPASEPTALGSAFDRYDTSNVDPESRNTILSSPGLARSGPGLEPIPGSRPDSPEESITFPTPPSKRQKQQQQSSPPRTLDSMPSSPPSSPPNFSRPTSRAQNQHRQIPSVQFRQPRETASMTDLIHPLFRPDSPAPPQILSANTMVTASPLASQPITPKTLSRLRSESDIRNKQNIQRFNATYATGTLTMQSKDQWCFLPNMEPRLTKPTARPRSQSFSAVSPTRKDKRPATADSPSPRDKRPFTAGSPSPRDKRPTTAESEANSTTGLTRSDSLGSPGPSVASEEELPPILPGFVLSAGSRSSLIWYGKRKSVKRNSASLMA